MRMRRHDRQVTDINEIVKILDKSKVVHLGMAGGGEPYVVPMNYGYTLNNGALTLYLHCAYNIKEVKHRGIKASI